MGLKLSLSTKNILTFEGSSHAARTKTQRYVDCKCMPARDRFLGLFPPKSGDMSVGTKA